MKRFLMIALALMVGVAGSFVALGADKEGKPPSGSAMENPCMPTSGMGPGMMETGGQGMMMGPGMAMSMEQGMAFGMMMMMGISPEMMGHGMMGHGPFAAGADIPDDKWEQLQKAHLESMRAMRPKMKEMRERMSALAELMRTFPVDQKAVAAQWASMGQLRDEFFRAHVAMLAQAQQILGKESWEKLNTGWPMMGPPGGQGTPHKH